MPGELDVYRDEGYTSPTGIAARGEDPYQRKTDPWSFVDHKDAMGRNAKLAPTWVGEHRRRLTAYHIYEDYYRNAARFWLSDATDEEKSTRREYGDPFVVVETYLNSLLGNDQSIVVPEAGKKNPPSAAVVFQDALLDWAETQQLDTKVEECERQTLKLGDGVYVLHPREKQEPLVETWNAGFYFPVLDPAAPSSQYPRKVHIAYEYEEEIGGKKVRCVRRYTWELVTLQAQDDDGIFLVDEEQQPVQGYRPLPWNSKSTETCVYSVEVFRIATEDQKSKDDLKLGMPYRVEVERHDMEIDFLPVVHIPGLLPSLEEHYGLSIMAPIMQIFDDIAGTDTDLAAASRTTGTPALAVSGQGIPVDAQGRVTTWGPGQVFNTGDGNATLIDTSSSLDALLKMNDSQLKRLSVNSRIPESMLGRIKPSEVPSGITLTLSFGPHTGVITKMRKIRRRKYALLLKFVGRLMMKAGLIAEIFPVEYHFGSFLPADRSEVMDLVIQGVSSNPPVISHYTAIRMLVEAGLPIEDAQAELTRIIQEDFTTANEALDATGDPGFVRNRLGITAPPPAPPEPAGGGA